MYDLNNSSITRIYIEILLLNTSTSRIYSLSLHDALPIWRGCTEALARRNVLRDVLGVPVDAADVLGRERVEEVEAEEVQPDRKSTRLNSSHPSISYADFCLKKKSIIKDI